MDYSEYSVLHEPAFQQITYQEPYISLDELSRVDSEAQTITIHLSGGAYDSENHIYALQYDSSEGRDIFVKKALK